MKWHSTARELLIRTGKNGNYDKKWGKFKPCQRFNVDQYPLPFAVDTKCTYKVVEPGSRYNKLWIARPGSGFKERSMHPLNLHSTKWRATTYCCYFLRARKENCKAWAPSMTWWYWCMFSQNAWENTEFFVAWVEKHWNRLLKKSRFLLFCDHLTAQTSDSFKAAISNFGGLVWFGV